MDFGGVSSFFINNTPIYKEIHQIAQRYMEFSDDLSVFFCNTLLYQKKTLNFIFQKC